jgi:hypothetical protein
MSSNCKSVAQDVRLAAHILSVQDLCRSPQHSRSRASPALATVRTRDRWASSGGSLPRSVRLTGATMAQRSRGSSCCGSANGWKIPRVTGGDSRPSPFRGPSVRGSISSIPCSVRIFCKDDDDNCALMIVFAAPSASLSTCDGGRCHAGLDRCPDLLTHGSIRGSRRLTHPRRLPQRLSRPEAISRRSA